MESKLALLALSAVASSCAWLVYKLGKGTFAAPGNSEAAKDAFAAIEGDPKLEHPTHAPIGGRRKLKQIPKRIWLIVPGDSFIAKLTFVSTVATVLALPPVIWWAYNWMQGRDAESTGARIEQRQRAQGDDIRAQREDIQELKRMWLEKFDPAGGASAAGPKGQSRSAPGPTEGLNTDLEAGIETLLNAGREAALRDKTGEAAQSALDELIAKRQTTRNLIVKDEAALWRQKGAFAFLENTEAAIRAYSRAADIDPNNVEGWYQLGQLQMRGGYLPASKASFERALGLRNSIAEPWLAHWAHMLLGDVEAALGNRAAALVQYDRAGDLIKALAARDPNNAEWQRDLSVSYNKIGDISAARGDRDGALKAYEDGLGIRKALAGRDPNNAEWQADLVVSAWKLVEVGAPDACAHLRKGLAILKRLDAENRLTADQEAWIPDFEGAIASQCG